MRISTSMMAFLPVEKMMDVQSLIHETQLQITTGKRILTPADDPYSAARVLDVDETVKIHDQYSLNASFLKNRLNIEESVLDAVTNSLQRVRELATAANNDSQTPESREFIAMEVEQIYDHIISLSNSQDSNKEYLFAGYQGKTRPFSEDGNGIVQYLGDDGQRELKIGHSSYIETGDSGKETFLAVDEGNGSFVIEEDPNNLGTGIIDPGSVIGSFVTDTYTIKYMPPSPLNLASDPNAPNEYYILDSAGLIVVPAAYAGAAETGAAAGDFLWDVASGTTSGAQHKEGSEIEGLSAYGIQTFIKGEPDTSTAPAWITPPVVAPVPPTVDNFTIRPSAKKSIFSTVQDVVNTLRSKQNNPAQKAHFHNSMNRALTNLDQDIGNILRVRAQVGSRLNSVDKQLEITESFNLQLKTTLSSLQDLDYAEAITDLNLQLLGLDAAQKTHNRVSGLSLFNYLG